MGIFDFFAKSDSTPEAESVKVLNELYCVINDGSLSRAESFEFLFNERKKVNLNVQEFGDYVISLDFSNFEKLAFMVKNENFETKEDLSVFIFVILYQESMTFRDKLRILSEKSRKDIFDMIHNTTLSFSKNAVVSKKIDFTNHCEKLFSMFEMMVKHQDKMTKQLFGS